MKLRKIKTEVEARAAMETGTGERPMVEFVTKDGNFTGVRIGQLHIGAGQYGSGIDLHRESPFDPASRVRVTAKVQGFPDQVHYFTEYSEATAKRDSYAPGTEVDVATNVDVLVDADGNVVREIGQGEPDELTF